MARNRETILSMNRTVVLRLVTDSDQDAALVSLRATFAAAREMVATAALREGCANRVRLHHLMYYALRARYPELGSQMTCNESRQWPKPFALCVAAMRRSRQ